MNPEYRPNEVSFHRQTIDHDNHNFILNQNISHNKHSMAMHSMKKILQFLVAKTKN